MTIQTATPQNLHEILSLFDKAQEWLIGMGYSDQWGTEPFSETQEERFMEWT